MNNTETATMLSKDKELEQELAKIPLKTTGAWLDAELKNIPHTKNEQKSIARRTALGFAAGLAAMPALILGTHIQQAPRGTTQSADYSLKNRFATAYVADTPNSQQTWTEVHTVTDEYGTHYYTTKYGYTPADGSTYVLMGVFALLGAGFGSVHATEAVAQKRKRLFAQKQQQTR